MSVDAYFKHYGYSLQYVRKSAAKKRSLRRQSPAPASTPAVTQAESGAPLQPPGLTEAAGCKVRNICALPSLHLAGRMIRFLLQQHIRKVGVSSNQIRPTCRLLFEFSPWISNVAFHPVIRLFWSCPVC